MPSTLAALAPLIGYRASDFDVDPAEVRATVRETLWNKLYSDDRSYFWYPYEVAVRFVRRHLAAEGFAGTILDHGCGAGNHLEFFTRLGLKAIGTEVAPKALEVVRHRFRGAKLACPALHALDVGAPLGPQLPDYDHAFAWLSVCYNPRARVIEDIGALADALPPNGVFLMALPSRQDISYRDSEPLADGSRRIFTDVSGQRGIVLTIPENEAEFVGWCRGIEIRDVGTFGWTIGGEKSEFHVVYGIKG